MNADANDNEGRDEEDHKKSSGDVRKTADEDR